MATEKNELDLEVSQDVLNDETKRKIIEKTYEIYSDESVNLSLKKGVASSNIAELEDNQIEHKKPIVTSKKINFDVNSLENLNPELQESIKKLLTINITRSEVSKLLKEIELEKNKFLKNQDGLFGKMSEKELELLDQKLAETEVSQEVTEVNLAAIVSCLNNLMSK